MALRIRCPQCRTIQRVKAGVHPVCPSCGFAGGVQAAPADAADPAASGSPDVAWETDAAPGTASVWGDPATEGQAMAAEPAPAGEQWGQSWPEGGQAEAPRKKGWFRRG